MLSTEVVSVASTTRVISVVRAACTTTKISWTSARICGISQVRGGGELEWNIAGLSVELMAKDKPLRQTFFKKLGSGRAKILAQRIRDPLTFFIVTKAGRGT